LAVVIEDAEDNKIGSIYLRCDDGCCMLVIDKYLFKTHDKHEFSYNISIQDSCLDPEVCSLKDRIKRAVRYVMRRPVCYNDLYLEDDDHTITKFIEEIQILIDKKEI
jgi:hypothetical protein